MLYRRVSLNLWSSCIGIFNSISSKGLSSTTWIWTLHALPHDFSMSRSCHLSVYRKIVSVGLAHLALVTLWLSGMLFHGAYFSNYVSWLRSPTSVKPSAQLVWSLVGQDILNGPLGDTFIGLYTTSGLFHIWRSQGLVSLVHLKMASFSAISSSIVLLVLAFLVIHVYPLYVSSTFSNSSALALSGLSSIAWSGHLVHIACPINNLLEAGSDCSLLSSPHSFLSIDVATSVLPEFHRMFSSVYWLNNAHCYPLTSSMVAMAWHHLYLGVFLIVVSIFLRKYTSVSKKEETSFLTGWHSKLSISLIVLSTSSFTFSNILSYNTSYAYLMIDYPTLVSLYVHHLWIGGFLLIGASAHASIFLIVEYNFKSPYLYVV
jgi:photosystem I P700 chlorophyll a apoprotein A1